MCRVEQLDRCVRDCLFIYGALLLCCLGCHVAGTATAALRRPRAQIELQNHASAVTIHMSQLCVVFQGDQRTVLQPPVTSRLRGTLCDLERRAHHKRNGVWLLQILVEPTTGWSLLRAQSRLRAVQCWRDHSGIASMHGHFLPLSNQRIPVSQLKRAQQVKYTVITPFLTSPGSTDALECVLAVC